VEISLHASGRTPPPLKFLIRSQPAHGALSEIRSSGPRSASVVYKHNPSLPAASDRFRFAVQAVDSAVSAPAEVAINISEAPPKISAPGIVEFGRVGIGESVTRQIPLKNTGGTSAVLRAGVNPPWSIHGKQEVIIPPGGEFGMTVAFSPQTPRAYEGTLSLTGFPDVRVSLNGEGSEPLTISPSKEIFLSHSSGRRAKLTVQNLSEASRAVRIEVPEGISFSGPREVPPGASAEFTLTIDPGWKKAIDGTLTISSGGFWKQVPIRGDAQPAVLASDDSIDFGVIEDGKRIERTFEIRNIGGLPASLVADIPPGMVIFPDPSRVVIPPEDSHKFTAALHADQDVRTAGKITFTTEGSPALAISWQAKRNVPRAWESSALPPFPSRGVPVDKFLDESLSDSASADKNDVWSPENGFELVSAVPGRIQIAWRAPDPPPARYSLEWRSLEFAGDDVPPSIHWRPMHSCRFSEVEGRVVADIMRLPPDSSWIVRFVLWDADGSRLGQSDALRIASPPRPPAPWGRLVLLALGIMVLAAAAFLYLRARRAARIEEQIRISRL
jgi:hypothetical protein